MKNYTRILSILALALLTIVMPATAQTGDNKNKAIVETADGTQQLNTDEISIIRFDGDKVIFVQPWGESVFDRTLRSLTFLRPLPGTLRLTVNAGINEHQTNRAQAIDGDGNLKTTWESGDVVYVYADETSTASIGTLTPTTTGSNSATLTGDIDATGLADNQQLYFSTQPRSTYSLTTQDGTVESLFYCTASDNVTIDGGNATISGNLDFIRPFAVVKFSLKDKNKATDDEINADKLVVTVDGNSYTVTPASATDELFVGIPSFSDKTVYLTANEGSTVYTYDKAGVYFEDGKYYAINVKMSEYNALNAPLTFEAMADGFTVTLTSNLDTKPSLQYSIDGGAWVDFTFSGNTATTDPVNIGHTIAFRGDNTAFFVIEGSPHTSIFTCSADCYLYGNIMSLLSASDYATATSVGEAAFLALFEGNTNIYSHDTKALVLPATTLASYCYDGLFYECTHLTTAPNLPAETLAEYCYASMFYGCTGLVKAPAISATTLAAHCCEGMFHGCTSLTTGPTLSATTLADYCYYYMFQDCSNLNSVTCLATTNLSAESCTSDWLDGVAATGTFTAANNTVMWYEGSSGIPSGWTRVNQCNIVDLATLTGDYEAKNGDILINTLAGNYKITIANGATVTLRDATINGVHDWDYEWAGITCLGNATIILEGTNTVKGFCSEYPGIQAAHNGTGSGDEYTLTIQGTGSLTASSNGKATGIGADKNNDCGNITISGGTITATGGDQAAGIGSSTYGECGNITISGGNITASGGDNAAGIGSGEGRTCGNITISGGTITATGKDGGAGIGTGGTGASCGNIFISGGTITATGGSKSAGIGTGKALYCGSITITSDVNSVTATKGASATNSIGVGGQGTCGTVTIGGTVYYQDNAYVGDGATYLTQSTIVYPAPVPVENIVDLSKLTADYEAQSGDILINTLAGNYKITIGDGATVTLRGATINGIHDDNYNYNWAGITCLGDATIVLEEDNTVKGFVKYYPGIYVPSGKTLTIQGTGSLDASSNGTAAGIGGGYWIGGSGNIVINSGTITATGSQGAGIGAGSGEASGDITINGGTITASSTWSGAGIGGGTDAACGNIIITGGTIVAIGNEYAAGIGSGNSSSATCTSITISGGTVTATGSEYQGAGIGGSAAADCGNINITGGTIVATGGEQVGGIGGGYYAACGAIVITDGVTSVTATKGYGAPNNIGAGKGGTCGTVTIGGTVYWGPTAGDPSEYEYKNSGAIYLPTSPLIYPNPNPSVPIGAINGKFTINAGGDKVYFSRGNLQASGTDSSIPSSGWTWGFADHQYDHIGNATANNAVDGDGDIWTEGKVDLFGWSTAATYFGIHNSKESTTYSGDFVDWGGNIGSGWKTLTKDEWVYLFANHTKGWATVDGVGGYVIRPDGVSTAVSSSYTASAWATEEAAGSVFLPVTGYRDDWNVNNPNYDGYYWSSSPNGADKAHYVLFYLSGLYTNDSSLNRSYGMSVRLVKDAE